MTLEGADIVSRSLDAMADRYDAPLLVPGPEIDRVFERIVEQQFATEGAHGGEPWAPLKPATQKARARKGYGTSHPILEQSGEMKRSLVGKTGDTISVHTERYWARGTADPKFAFHQSKSPRSIIPRRAVISFTSDDINELLRPVRLYLRGHSPARTVQQDSRLSETFGRRPGG